MVKELSIEDSDRFLELGQLVNDNFKKLYSLENLLNDSNYKLIGYYDDNILISFLVICISIDSDDICDIVVDDMYRKQGIASKMLNYYFDSINNKEVFLEVNVNNKPAIGLYNKFDFEVINIRKGYYNGTDAYVMRKKVK